jgi:hypothetical protein
MQDKLELLNLGKNWVNSMPLTPQEQRELDELELQELEAQEGSPQPSPSSAAPEKSALLGKAEESNSKMLSTLSPEAQKRMGAVRGQVGTPEGVNQLGAAMLGGPGLGTLKKFLTAGQEGLKVAKRSIPGLGEAVPAYAKRLEDLIGKKYVPAGEELLSGEQAIAAKFGLDPAKAQLVDEGMKSISPEIRDAMAQKAIEMSSREATSKVFGPQALLGLAMGNPKAAAIGAIGPVSGGLREAARQLGKSAPVGPRLPIAGLFSRDKEVK